MVARFGLNWDRYISVSINGTIVGPFKISKSKSTDHFIYKKKRKKKEKTSRFVLFNAYLMLFR